MKTTTWPRGAFTAVLWFSALLVQSLGLLHGYVHPHAAHWHDGYPHHARQAQASAGTGLGAGTAAAAQSTPPARGGLHAMFADHDDGSAGCTLFDQLTHADLLHGVSALALDFAAPVQPDAVHAAWHHATQVTGFLARAPPPAIG